MDCSICSAMPYILRPPRNTICGACYEGARSIITFTSKLDNEKGTEKTSNSSVSSSNSSKGFANALKWVKEMKELEEELLEKISFLSGFAAAFRDQIHTDIQVKPGNDGPSIPGIGGRIACAPGRARPTRLCLPRDGNWICTDSIQCMNV